MVSFVALQYMSPAHIAFTAYPGVDFEELDKDIEEDRKSLARHVSSK